MTETVSIVFPHQIFEDNPCLDKHRRVFIVEDDLFFSHQPFHKMKLILHRASMKFYADYLANKDYRVTYIDHADYDSMDTFFKRDLSDEKVKEIHFCDPVDFLLSKRMKRYAKKYNLKLVRYESPMFMNTKEENEELLGEEQESYVMAEFYKKQRKRFNLLIEDGKPEGGSWSHDKENRKSLPKNYTAPMPNFPEENQYVDRAKEYVEENFSDHPGKTSPFIYPVTFEDAHDFYDNFLNYRFNDYGPYQDALSSDQPFLNHSLISSSMNCGLLAPEYVIEKMESFIEENDIRLSSVEGFVRQIIGWREFIRAIYERHGVKERTTNFWNNSLKINGDVLNTIYPLDQVHRKADSCAYTHHIERLMVLGNFFLISEIHPDKVYDYFMTYFIDAYDWVMVPNVYGMSQFADGGLMATKPYISSSNYLKKMGVKTDKNWTEIWDALYWRFLYKNKSFFESNHRTKMMVYHLDKMSEEKLNGHLKKANNFLNRLSSI